MEETVKEKREGGQNAHPQGMFSHKGVVGAQLFKAHLVMDRKWDYMSGVCW